MILEQEKKHAKYSASGSHRWLKCPASVALSEKAPPSPSSIYAEEGTMAHSGLEMVLREFYDDESPYFISDLESLHREMGLFPSEMLDHIFYAVREIDKIHQRHQSPEIKIEHKVDLSFVFPETYGTVDVSFIEEFSTLTIIDFKYGAGVPVEPKDNSQLLFYALGLAHEYNYNFTEIRIVIIQPRAEHEDGYVREWICSIEELLEWRDRFEKGVALCEDPLAPFNSGDHCRWCPAKSMCPEISSGAMKQALIDFDEPTGEMSLPMVNERTPTDYLSVALTASDKLAIWIKGVKQAAFDALRRGEKIPGYKLVDKKSIRRWAYDMEVVTDALVNEFGEEVFEEPKLKSPAQIEKTFGKKSTKAFIEMYSSNVSSGLTLVSENDMRAEARSSAEIDFEEGEMMPIYSPKENIMVDDIRKEKAIAEALEESKKRKKKIEEKKKNGKRKKR